MLKKDFIKLKVGKYELTDGIYNYDLYVGLNDDNSKYYKILEKGSSQFSANIFIVENVVEDEEDGEEYIELTAISGVGGLKIQSTDVYSILSRIKIV